MNKCFILLPVIAAFIGWLANGILLRLLFHPILPKKILGFTIQGILPKYQYQIAQEIGRLVSKEFFSFKEIEDKIAHPDNIKKIMPLVEVHIDEFLRHKITAAMPMLSMFIGDKTIAQLKEVFMKELEVLFPELLKGYLNNLQKDIDLEQIITDKLSGFSLYKLEQTFTTSMPKLQSQFKLVGAAVGFSIGLIQLLLMFLLK